MDASNRSRKFEMANNIFIKYGTVSKFDWLFDHHLDLIRLWCKVDIHNRTRKFELEFNIFIKYGTISKCCSMERQYMDLLQLWSRVD